MKNVVLKTLGGLKKSPFIKWNDFIDSKLEYVETEECASFVSFIPCCEEESTLVAIDIFILIEFEANDESCDEIELLSLLSNKNCFAISHIFHLSINNLTQY